MCEQVAVQPARVTPKGIQDCLGQDTVSEPQPPPLNWGLPAGRSPIN